MAATEHSASGAVRAALGLCSPPLRAVGWARHKEGHDRLLPSPAVGHLGRFPAWVSVPDLLCTARTWSSCSLGQRSGKEWLSCVVP